MKNKSRVVELNDSSKRRLLVGTAAVTAAALTSNVAFASGGQSSGHHHHKVNKGLLAASNDCVQTAKACHSHCLVLVANGDTSIAECMKSVVETAAICDTFSELLTLNSQYTKGLAKLCSKACQDCEDLCRKHAKKHKECEQCADACAVMVKALKKMVA